MAVKYNEDDLPDEVMIFGANMRRLRQDLGIPLRDFARQVDMSYSYLSEMERGRVNLTFAAANVIATAFKLSIVDLLVPSPDGPKRIFRPSSRRLNLPKRAPTRLS